MPPPFKRLAYLYVGSRDHDADLAYYRDVLGGEVVWDLTGFGAHVFAVRLFDGPLVLLADHEDAPSNLPVVEVADLDATVAALMERGWAAEGHRFEIPNGPCEVFRDPSGNRWALFEDVRPRPFEPGGSG